MTKTSSPLFPTVERFSGFAEVYDQYRPNPPAELGDILPHMIHMPVPALVVDLGCGTGLSTRFWAERARQVIGMDPNEEMLAVARVRTGAKNIAYVYGYGHLVALISDCADIITCSQSLHWMDPQLTLLEVARLLRPGGVFAVYDHTSLVMPGWEIEAAQRAFQERADTLENELGITAQVPRWPKQAHLLAMQASGLFRYTGEFYLHQVEMGNAQFLIGGILSSGQIQSLFKAGVTEKELGLDGLRAQAQELLGDELRPWYLSVHVRIGIV
jgi:ubiquinone/menaquinone biosynthesis C-methylase UbiE